jgi:hypothetical protein
MQRTYHGEGAMPTNLPSSRRPGRTDWTSIFAACGVLFAIILIMAVHPVR